jgi:hypothetical protein
MDIKFTAFLYSKFSQNSKNFTQLLERIPDDFKNNIKFNSLCVDNENIRKTVLNSKQFDIKNVPCVLVTYNDGRVEKFEGSDAFKWADDVIVKINHKVQVEQQMLQQQIAQQQALYQQQTQQHLPHAQPHAQPHGQQHVQQHVQPHGQQHVPPQPNNSQVQQIKQRIPKKKVVEVVEDETDDESEIEVKKVKNIKKQKKGKTSIDDIDTEDENENDFTQDLQKNTEIYPEMQQKESSNALNAKKESLMSAAMAMQKTRESYDKNIKNPQMMNLGR